MRGIETALLVYTEVENGAFTTEVLRKLYTNIAPSDRTLAATLVYCSLRRQGLWKHLLIKYCRRSTKDLSALTSRALIVGIAGIVELKYFALPVLINGIVQAVKNNGNERDISLVNAVLHTVADEAKSYLAELKTSSALRDQALFWGVPSWVAAQWSKDTSIPEAKKLIRSNGMRTYLSLRLAQGADKEKWLTRYNVKGKKAWPSDFLERSVRTAANPYPLDLPGYGEGLITPQSESSMAIVESFVRRIKDGPVLDMCCGRGIKTGQIADMRRNIDIEAWDISEPKIRSAEFEMMRMKGRSRVKFKVGNALSLMPDKTPQTVFLDAPCSGSGTWRRHPEGKWRSVPKIIEKNAELQKDLLEKAVTVAAPGGLIVYSTCSLFRAENEKVVAAVMARHPELTELRPERINSRLMVKGKPYGTVIWPGLPWVDGFYFALLTKRK